MARMRRPAAPMRASSSEHALRLEQASWAAGSVSDAMGWPGAAGSYRDGGPLLMKVPPDTVYSGSHKIQTPNHGYFSPAYGAVNALKNLESLHFSGTDSAGLA